MRRLELGLGLGVPAGGIGPCCSLRVRFESYRALSALARQALRSSPFRRLITPALHWAGETKSSRSKSRLASSSPEPTRITRNSSPPRRAKMSPGWSSALHVRVIWTSRRSPAACPSRSFTRLKSSRSTSADRERDPRPIREGEGTFRGGRQALAVEQPGQGIGVRLMTEARALPADRLGCHHERGGHEDPGVGRHVVRAGEERRREGDRDQSRVRASGGVARRRRRHRRPSTCSRTP